MCDAIKKHLPGADMALIDRAVDYANRKHKVQKRKDGSPYIIHPLAVAQIVAEMGLDCDAILGALLHDCIEDTSATYAEIAKEFSPAVADLVEGVSKLTRVQYASKEEEQMENLRKMLMAMAKDIRVILIKLAIIFLVLKLFFFPDFINTNAKNGDKAGFVSKEILNR